LIIVGAEDPITPLSVADYLHQHITGSQLVTIPGAGHMSNMEAPGQFNEALLAFLGRRS
jgi:3-oxoadipate enol-lactonase